MRASFDRLHKSLGYPTAPRHIWQKAFDYDSSHYVRLCNLNGAVPEVGDLCTYVDDLRYSGDVQPDLLRFLLPFCLQVWRDDLFSRGFSGCGGFVENFSPALLHLNQQTMLDAKAASGVAEFMRDSILDRMDAEEALSFVGMNSSPYQWFSALGSFAVIFPHVEDLWRAWWKLETPGHARAALQYLSCLMYTDDANPVFAPWTGDKGGGAPNLAETDGHIYEDGWRAENVAFIRATLSVEYFRERLDFAAQVLAGDTCPIPQQIRADFEKQLALLEMRIEQLPSLLSMPVGYVDWIV